MSQPAKPATRLTYFTHEKVEGAILVLESISAPVSSTASSGTKVHKSVS